MPFNIPERVPSASQAQREKENTLWRANKFNGSANTQPTTSIGARIKELLSQEEDLPMYKDKPHFPHSKRKKPMNVRLLALFFIFLSVFFFKIFVLGKLNLPGEEGERSVSNKWLSPSTTKHWAARRDAVREAFITSWEGYEKYAWGMDEYRPVSKKGKNFGHGGGIGWIVIDALDTAILMNLTTQVKHARDWMKTSLTFATDVEVNTFETTIRVLGGLLSAHFLSTTFPDLAPQTDDDHHQSGEDLYLELATDLAERLSGAFETQSGIPSASVNINTSVPVHFVADGGASSTAEVATLQLELKYLAHLTGEPMYWQFAQRVMQIIEANQRPDGLVPIHIYPGTGQFRGQNIRLGSRGDSYYEYLIKQYLQTGSEETVYQSMWEEALEGIKKHLVVYSKNADLTIVGERQAGLTKPLTPKMDHLACFLPGAIALAVTGGHTIAEARAALGAGWTKEYDENLRLAEELLRTCWATYKATKTGLGPEITYFEVDEPPRMWAEGEQKRQNTFLQLELEKNEDALWRTDVQIHEQDLHNLQRPETVESLFYLWKITGKEIYREWGWEMFESFMTHSRVEDAEGQVYGYTSINNVNMRPAGRKKRDNMEGFWLAETLKYFWLLFGGNEAEMGGPLALTRTVLNTEAHFLPRFELGRLWKTGWDRTNPKFGGKQTDSGDGHTSGEPSLEDQNQLTGGKIVVPKVEDPHDFLSGLGEDRKEAATGTTPDPQVDKPAEDDHTEHPLNIDSAKS